MPFQTAARHLFILLFICLHLPANALFAQSEPAPLASVLGEEILPPQVALFQMKEYLLKRVAKPPSPSSAEQWTAASRQLREKMLGIAFKGWPKEWVNASSKFEELGVIETGKGYRIRKLRYEIVPGFQSTALLYEPEKLVGKVPAILNVNGHVGAPGKSVEYKQKRCINFAKRGILALNLEWLSFGELAQKGNEHWFGAHLDLVGANELGLFILAMRRGLDYLYDHTSTDRTRLGVTGLSGGGWQTIVLSSLDERVTAAAPVAGFSSFVPRIEARWFGDLGDIEQSATDVFDGQDFTHLAALMAPRPLLLTYNAEDDCCFRAPLVKPLTFDFLEPIYKLYGNQNALAWHENRDPGTHNYQLDNRLAVYRFFSQNFRLPLIESEIPSEVEIKSYDELVVGLSRDNLTTVGVARKLASLFNRPPAPVDASARSRWAESERTKLKSLVRYKPTSIERAWTVANTKNKGVETKSLLFSMQNGLGASALWAKGIGQPENAPITIVLNDKGKQAAAIEVSDRINRGDQVLALDLLFMGDSWKGVDPHDYVQILHGFGDRPVGMQAGQLLEIARWIRARANVAKVRLECRGMRNQVAALIASAMEPDLFSEIVNRQGISSLGYLLEKPVEFQAAPELFCLDLYRDFDIDRLAVIASPTRIVNEHPLEAKGQQ